MERDIMDVVLEKKYFELTEAEKVQLSEICTSEEEYDQLRYVLGSVNALYRNETNPKKETKERLDHLFVGAHPKAPPVWYNSTLAVLLPADKPIHRKPMLQVAAIGILIFFSIPFLKTWGNAGDDTPRMAENRVEKAVEKASGEGTNRNVPPESEKMETANEQGRIDETREIQHDADNLSAETPSGNADPQAPTASGGNSDLMFAASTAPTARFTGSAASGSGIASGEVEKDRVVTESADETLALHHPDGVFEGVEIESFSQPASGRPDVLDLLTTTF